MTWYAIPLFIGFSLVVTSFFVSSNLFFLCFWN